MNDSDLTPTKIPGIEIRSEDLSRCLGHMSIAVREGVRSLDLHAEPPWPPIFAKHETEPE